jgi:glycosyltransferase involved in cell wall biosynthesis
MAEEAQAGGDASESPLVSVIVPAFDAEAMLAETLRSIAGQTYRKLEILIVDDGSTDRTGELAEAFCSEEPRAMLLRKANGGVASARNFGIAHAQGEWIAPIDSDDLWHPTKIAKQVAAALAVPEPPGFVYCWFRTIDPEGRVTGSGERHVVDGPALHRLAYVNFVGNGSAPLIWRTAAAEAGGYEESLQAAGAPGCDDPLLQLQVARERPIACVPEYLVGYRTTPGSISDNHERMFRSWGLALTRFRGGCADVPQRIWRWNLGRRTLTLAESRMLRGDWGGGAAMLARALRLDPGRTIRILAYRLGRWLGKRLGGPRGAPERPRFLELDTRAPFSGDRHEIHGWTARLEVYERRRMERLAAEDGDAALAKPPRSQ